MKKILIFALAGIIMLLSFGCESSGITALKVYLQQKRISEAIREGEAAIAMDPNNADAYYWTGVAYIERQEYDAASNYIDLALQRGLTIDDLRQRSQGEGLDNWDYHQVFLAGGVIALGNEDFQQAAKYLQISVEINPEDATPYAILGSVYRDIGNYDSMMTYYNISLDMDPSNYSALRNMGLYYLNQEEDYEKAVETFDLLLTEHDTAASVWYYQGLAYIQMANQYGSEGDLENREKFLNLSERSFSKSAVLEPETRTSEIALYRAIALVSLEKFAEAIPVLEEAVTNIDDEDPNKDKILYNLGLSYNKEGEYQKAVDVLTQAIEINPESRYYNLRADCYNKLGMPEKAREDLLRATGQ
jgi:tetratricopeptide (TPR) repeat protein